MSFSSSITYFIYLLPILRATSNNQQILYNKIFLIPPGPVYDDCVYLFEKLPSKLPHLNVLVFITNYTNSNKHQKHTIRYYTIDRIRNNKMLFYNVHLSSRSYKKIIFSSKHFYHTKFKIQIYLVPIKICSLLVRGLHFRNDQRV